MKPRKTVQLRGEVLEDRRVLAPFAEPVADLEPTPYSAQPDSFVAIGDTLFFYANADGEGYDLWKTDGTTAGTRSVIGSGLPPEYADHVFPENMTAVGDLLYFRSTVKVGSDYEHWLWRSDGTSEGTFQLALVDSFAAIDGQVVFKQGNGLWVTDGTPQGTLQLDLPNPEPPFYYSYRPAWQPVRSGSTAFIVLELSQFGTVWGRELWRTDGTQSGMSMAVDLEEAGLSNSAYISELTAVGEFLYFYTGRTGDATRTLWRSDGTLEGTAAVKDFAIDTYYTPSDFSGEMWLVDVAGTLYFTFNSIDVGVELWRSDGTPNGTRMVKDVWPGRNGSRPYMQGAVGSTLYFTAEDPASGREWWRTDGTEAGTQQLFDLYPGSFGSQPRALGIADGIIYFTADHNDGLRGVWRTDGTATGTWRFGDSGESYYYYYDDNDVVRKGAAAFQGNVYFRGADAFTGNELWRTDDAGRTASLFVDIGPNGIGSHYTSLVGYQGELYFAATQQGRPDIYTTAGAGGGVRPVREDWPEPAGSGPVNFVVLDGAVLFYAYGSGQPNSGKRGLWRTDGTSSGTFSLAEVDNWIIRKNPLVAGGNAFFTVDTDKTGRELWRTDGTLEGTRLVREIRGGRDGILIESPVTLGERLVFSADDGVHGEELWVSDGTAEGTYLIKDIRAGDTWSEAIASFAAGGLAYFTAIDDTGYAALWRTDGTTQGTRKISDLDSPTSTYTSSLRYLANLGDWTYFSVSLPQSAAGIWKTDGSPEGTRRISDRAFDGDAVVLGDTVAFLDIDEQGHAVLWSIGSDDESLIKVVDFGEASMLPWADVSQGNGPAVADGRWHFAVRSDDQIERIFASDGTTAGTRLLGELPAGFASRRPAVFGTATYFGVYSQSRGVELWKANDAGVRLAVALTPPGASSYLPNVFPGDGVLYLGMQLDAYRSELWRSDGTPAGTGPLYDPATGVVLGMPVSNNPAYSTPLVHDGQIYFGAGPDFADIELWVSDGSPAGTRRVKDIRRTDFSDARLFASQSVLYGSIGDGYRSYSVILDPASGFSIPDSLLPTNFTTSSADAVAVIGDDVYLAAR